MAHEADLVLLAELQEMVQSANVQIDELVEQKKALIFSQRERQKQEMSEMKDTKRVLQQKLVEVTELQKTNGMVAQKQAEEIGAVNKELEEVKHKESMGTAQRARLEAELAALVKEKQGLEEALAERGQGVVARKKEMNKGLALYRDRLGLEFERVDEDTLRFVFTRIDPEQESKPFCCSIFVDKENKYQVPSCEPAVRYEDLLRSLNENNDFSAFIRAIRRRFQDFAKST